MLGAVTAGDDDDVLFGKDELKRMTEASKINSAMTCQVGVGSGVVT